MEERFGALEASMAETEKTVKKQQAEMEKKENQRFVNDNRLNLMLPSSETSTAIMGHSIEVMKMDKTLK